MSWFLRVAIVALLAVVGVLVAHTSMHNQMRPSASDRPPVTEHEVHKRKVAVTVLFGKGNREKRGELGDGLVDGACVLRQTMLKHKPDGVDLSFFGLVRSLDDVGPTIADVLRTHCGFTLTVGDNITHVDPKTIQSSTLRREIEERAVGTLELLKLHSLLMVEYEVVLCLDADVMFVGPFDDLLVPMPHNVPYRQTPDCNGGMVVYFPRHDGARHVKNILDALKRTPYTTTTGYAGTGYGAKLNALDGLSGGPMLQGLLPFYVSRSLKLRAREQPIAIRPCLHNFYVSPPDHKICDKAPRIHSVHFKGGDGFFPKPWECNLVHLCTRSNCRRFMRQFLEEHKLLLQRLPQYNPREKNGCRSIDQFYGVSNQLNQTAAHVAHATTLGW